MISEYLHPGRPFAVRMLTLLLVLLSALLAGCSALGGNSPKEALADVEWGFAEDAILIEMASDDRLNEHNGEPHTLLLGIYQVASADDFRKLSGDSASLMRLLESAKPSDKILNGERYVVAPGRRTILSLDRAAKARAVGIVAGYYRIGAQPSARLFEVPLAMSRDGLIATTYSAQPQPLAIRLQLGPTEIATAERLNPEPLEVQRARVAQRPRQLLPLDGGGREIPLDSKPADSGAVKLAN